MEYILHIEGNSLCLKGATKVVSATATQAVVEAGGKNIVIAGCDIEVKRLNLEENEVNLQGNFSQIKMGQSQDKKQPLLKRIFK